MYIQKYLHIYRPVKSTKSNDKKTKMKRALKDRLFCYNYYGSGLWNYRNRSIQILYVSIHMFEDKYFHAPGNLQNFIHELKLHGKTEEQFLNINN